jgi:hypothetical protein
MARKNLKNATRQNRGRLKTVRGKERGEIKLIAVLIPHDKILRRLRGNTSTQQKKKCDKTNKSYKMTRQ